MYKFDRAKGFGLLALVSLFAFLGGVILEALGVTISGFGPLPFVGTVVFLQFGLFAFWPFLKKEFQGTSLPDQPARLEQVKARTSRSISLWSDKDPRLDVCLFDSNVPTFIINHEQKILDWNPAFQLAFAEVPGLRVGDNVDEWYKCLDNFRSMAKRTDELYGEAILPLTDRERVSFISKRFGRMVFTKLMNPIIDRGTGKFIGWTIVLNINSVGRRQQFFGALHESIKNASQKARYAASYDAIFGSYSGYRRMLRSIYQILQNSKNIVDLGCGTGKLGQLVVNKSPFAKVTLVDRDKEMLRQARRRAEKSGGRLKVVRQDLNAMTDVPCERFDAAVCLSAYDGIDNLQDFFEKVYGMLQPGGIFVLGHLTPEGEINELMDCVRREFESRGDFDTLKAQLHQVEEYEKRQLLAGNFKAPSAEKILQLMKSVGFRVDQSTRISDTGWLAYAVKPLGNG